MTTPAHVPVLLDEVLDALAIAPGETHVDGTFGAGGYTKAMLEKGAAHDPLPRQPPTAEPPFAHVRHQECGSRLQDEQPRGSTAKRERVVQHGADVDR